MDKQGIIFTAYYVRHRKTGQIALVDLGAKYNQRDWEVLYPVTMDA